MCLFQIRQSSTIFTIVKKLISKLKQQSCSHCDQNYQLKDGKVGREYFITLIKYQWVY